MFTIDGWKSQYLLIITVAMFHLVCKFIVFVIDLYILFCILSSIPLEPEGKTRGKYWLMYMYIHV